jgi:hypothetical protein
VEWRGEELSRADRREKEMRGEERKGGNQGIKGLRIQFYTRAI